MLFDTKSFVTNDLRSFKLSRKGFPFSRPVRLITINPLIIKGFFIECSKKCSTENDLTCYSRIFLSASKTFGVSYSLILF